ncbi:tail fiber domain-containing protein [Klebsiella variicola]|uniref:tail fiber domain-containing protein n=6 Tax=Klebsiella pneumoniae complex TaxID=3390273 RepID=UPI002B05885E|nr:tail fiber domain-containing protein [Klebsiella variicola]
MMYQRTDLTLSMFYASSADADGNKVATLTMQVIAAEAGAVQTSQLRCITDSAKKKTYSVGEQSVSNGSDPLLVAIENYWRQSTDVVVKGLIAEVTDFIAGNINSVSTWIGQFGMKVFENQPLDERLPESVLQADGGSANTSKGKVLTQAIELSMSTPYIDFHYNGSSADYTARLIHDRQNRLNAQVQSFWVTDGRITASSTMPANPAIGTQLTSNPVRSLMAGRGAYGDVDGAYVQMYMEEQVGTEHRLVLYADGFGRTDAWIFRAGGTISTGKGDVLTTGSDVRLKDAFMEPQEGACRRINSLGVCEFNMKGETRRRRGFIAQQAEKVDDLYTFLGIEQEIDGEKFRVMNVDYTAIIADLVTVVQDLIRRVDALES